MMKRTCSICGMINFSTAEEEKYWKCNRCGNLIGKEYQTHIEPVKKEKEND